MAAKLLCPMCKSPDVEVVSQDMKKTLNLNPLHPFTLHNYKPKGKARLHCRKCGFLFEKKV